MQMAQDEVSAAEIRKKYKGQYRCVGDAILYALSKDWVVRDQGHGVRLYCPCGGQLGRAVSVAGTPKFPGSCAKNIRRTVDKCPDDHDLIPGPR
ncbi:hypothetical protein AXK60_06570 [Tsukamurella pseudospumae]|uniref:Uncharacterized protein n=1 Tax=Tsukamurella pseudospumae TaxID=239498 RepID=A0A138AIF1_9ACTN|nr:hypothetical protein AXK60_06570 [Tsukamurella pseudospumae]